MKPPISGGGIPISGLVGQNPDAFHSYLEKDKGAFRVQMTYAVLPDAKIHIETLDQHAQRLSSWVVNTRDKLVRRALIDMGWTPPPDEKDLSGIQKGPRVGQAPETPGQASSQPQHPPHPQKGLQ